MDHVWLKSDLSDEIMQNENFIDNSNEIVKDIVSGQLDITAFVENLSTVLTDVNPEFRQRGMEVFSTVLEGLPKEYLTELQLKFISTFYTDRLKDNHRVIPAVLRGLLAISEMKNFPLEAPAQFFPVLFREVPCQQQVRQDRINLFKLIKGLLDTRLKDLQTLGSDFVFGVISALDGERDPRNLMFVFSFLPKFIQNITLGNLAEEMFDVISCYFPVDFNTSPKDETAVTRQALADALCPCLCATIQFAEFCLPLLIEKLNSSLRLAKLDSLKLLAESCKTFDASSYSNYLTQLWPAIQRELMHKSDDDLILASHQALYALVEKLSETANTDQEFENFVKGILISMQSVMVDVQAKTVFNMAANVVLTTANASKQSCCIVCDNMVLILIAYYEMKLTDKLQVAVLENLAQLFTIAKRWNLVTDLHYVLKEVTQLCIQATSQSNVEIKIAGLNTITSTVEIFPSDLILTLSQNLFLDIHYRNENDLFNANVRCLHALAQKYPMEIMDLIKNQFNFESITDEMPLFEKRIKVLCNLSNIEHFKNIVFRKLLQIISENDIHIATTTVCIMADSLCRNDLPSENQIVSIAKELNIVETILHWITRCISQTHTPDAIEPACNLIKIVMRNLKSDSQKQLIEKYGSKYEQELRNGVTCYIITAEALCNSLHEDVFTESLMKINYLAVNIACTNENDYFREKACILIAHMLNKVKNINDFDKIHSVLDGEVSRNMDIEGLMPNLVCLCGWVAKSLLLRAHQKFSFWIEKIIPLLSDQKYALAAANAFKLLVSDRDFVLSSKSHCTVSVLHRQRLFLTMLHTDKEANKRTGEAWMLTWAHVLKAAPSSVLATQTDKIAPIIVDSLIYDSQELLQIMLDLLSGLTAAANARIADSLQTIMPRLLALAVHNKSMEVRMRSLDCIFQCSAHYPTMLLIPMKTSVLAALAIALGDHKRLVRGAAVRARTRWFLVGAPGEAN